MKLALIVGTGAEELDLGCEETVAVETPYGRVVVGQMTMGDAEVCVLTRHGEGHRIPPHRVNYRANIDALKRLGCRLVIATNAVGSLRTSMQVGEFALPDQFLDFTKSRPSTFYDGGEDEPPRHVDVSKPYCHRVRGMLREAAADLDVVLHPAATYVCTEGPRFETPAEIRMFAQLGGDLVGMTGVPEVVLAREAGLCYASVCTVTNMAAGMAGAPLVEGEVTEAARESLSTLGELLRRAVVLTPEDPDCTCCGAAP